MHSVNCRLPVHTLCIEVIEKLTFSRLDTINQGFLYQLRIFSVTNKNSNSALFYTHLTVIVLAKLERHSWHSHTNFSYKFLTFWTQNPRDIRVLRGLVINTDKSKVECSGAEFRHLSFRALSVVQSSLSQIVSSTTVPGHRLLHASGASSQRWCRGTFGPPVGPDPSKPTAFLGLCSPGHGIK